MTDPDHLPEIKARRVAREDWFVSREPRRWYDDGSCQYCGRDQAGADQETGDLHEDDCPAASEPGPDIDWLVGEVERLTHLHQLDHSLADQRQAKVERLRELLARLEWAGVFLDPMDNLDQPACPACKESRQGGHGPGCWLAEALGRV
jgi:hypothetical protein